MAEAAKELPHYTEEMIPVSDLETDPLVQRPLDLHKVEKMKRNFSWDALGTITVSRRRTPNGTKRVDIIVDGQHRWRTVQEVTSNEGAIPCRVFEGLTLKQEAQLFLDLNFTTKPRVIDKFKVRGTAEDEAALEISDMLRARGWTVSPQVGNGNVAAVAAVERIYHLSKKLDAEPNLVEATIFVISKAWGNDRYGVQGALFEGIGRLLAEHGDLVDLPTLADKLSGYPGGPFAFLAQAQQWSKMKRIRIVMAVADLLTEEYNKGKRINTLPPWRKRS